MRETTEEPIGTVLIQAPEEPAPAPDPEPEPEPDEGGDEE